MTTKLHINQESNFNDVSCDEKEAEYVWKHLASEYTTSYPRWQYTAVHPVHPKSNGDIISHSESPMNLHTMYNDNYIRHKTTAPVMIRKLSHRRKTCGGRMCTKTTYNDSYTYKPTEVRSPLIPPPSQLHPMKGCDQTTQTSANREAYRPYTANELTAARRYQIQTPENMIMPSPEEKTSFTTMSRESYRYPDGCYRRSPIIHSSEMSRSQSAMELQTTQQADYTTKKINPSRSYHHATCKANKNEKWRPDNPKIAFAERSTFQDEYPCHKGYYKRPKCLKHARRYERPKIPFDTSTLYRENYTEKNKMLERPKLWIPKDNLQVFERQEFQGSAKYKNCHHARKEKDYERPPLGPKQPVPLKWPPISGDTSYSVDYKHFSPSDIGEVKNFKPIPGYAPPPRFKGVSTTQDHFRGTYGRPSDICRPIVKERMKYIPRILS